jgi:6-phosphofructokinase 1
LICLEDGHLNVLPFESLRDPATGRSRTRKVDIRSEHYNVARQYMIRLERRDLADPVLRAKLARAANMPAEDFDKAFFPV